MALVACLGVVLPGARLVHASLHAAEAPGGAAVTQHHCHGHGEPHRERAPSAPVPADEDDCTTCAQLTTLLKGGSLADRGGDELPRVAAALSERAPEACDTGRERHGPRRSRAPPARA